MLPLLLVALAGLSLLVERAAFLGRRSGVNPRPFLERLVSLARAQRYDEAVALCAEHRAALADLGLVILRSRASAADDLRAVAAAARLSFVPTLRRRLEWLPALAAIALLLGVAGASVNLAAIGVSAAEPRFYDIVDRVMRPLGAASLVAVPLVAGYAILANHVRTMTDHLDELSIRLINTLAGRPDVRLGHRDS